MPKPVEEDPDALWFMRFQRRRARIRRPFVGEAEAEFESLGPHRSDRRRVLVLRGDHGMLMPIPFLLFADEEIANEDAILLPIIHQLMVDAREKYEREN